MSSDYQWKPIEDLPADWPTLTDSELPAIRQVYRDFRALDPVATQRWELESRREWAIETGRVEDVYRWDRGTTETLMAKGIIPALIPRKGNDLEPEQIAAIIQNAQEVLEGLFEFVKGDRQLSKSYVHELHQALLKNVHSYRVTDGKGVVVEQKLEKGVYKRWPNSVQVNGGTHGYCPPEHVDAEMDRLIEWHRRHVLDDVAPEVEAAWLHHRFTQIHPYPDGNGRVARSLATLVLVKAGHFPLTIHAEEKKEYWQTLLEADLGKLGPFIQRIVCRQGRDLINVSQVVRLQRSPDQKFDSVHGTIQAIKRDIQHDSKFLVPDWTGMPHRVSTLREKCYQRLIEVDQELTSVASQPSIVEQSIDPTEEVNQHAALHLGPYNSRGIYFRFKNAGTKKRGLAEVVASWIDQGVEDVVGLDPFLISYAEQEPAQQRRFSQWMETALVAGLQKWRETLRA